MATLAGTQNNFKELVLALLNLEHDAIEAYDEVIRRLENKDYAKMIGEFKKDHERHVKELSKISSALGEKTPDGSMKSVLTAGKIVLADLLGDRAILKAMKSNEDDTVTAYERAVENECSSPALVEICQKALADEKRHRRWMEEKAESLRQAA